MEIRRWFSFVLIICVVIQFIDSKTVSLNELLAAEARGKQVADAPSAPSDLTDSSEKPAHRKLTKFAAKPRNKQLPENSASRKIKDFLKRSPLSKRLSLANLRKDKTEDKTTTIGDRIISPLSYRRKFQIKSPLRPKKLKLSLRSRQKRKNQSIKREITGNEGLRHKYIPLLKSLSMLFDNLLSSDESDSIEIKRKSYKRNRYNFEELFESSYERSSESNADFTKPRSQKKTTTPAPSFSSEISSDTEGFSSYENNDYSSRRSHKSVPVLLPRNTFSLRRDYHGPSQRSGSTHNRNPKGNIARDHGDNEYDTGWAENESCEEDNENITHSATRSDSSSIRHARRGGDGNNARNSKDRKKDTTYANKTVENKNNNVTIGAHQFEIRRNETESEDILREPIRRLRGSVPEDEISHDEGLVPDLIRIKEVHEESILNATEDSTGHKRITDQNGPLTTEDEKVRPGNETVITIERNSHPAGNYSNNVDKKRPMVLIFDGYSVTRDKNGENKVSGKTIHIRS